MAMAVFSAQQKDRNKQLAFLAITILLSFGFLVIKGFEWTEKFQEHHVMGPDFHYGTKLKSNPPPKPLDTGKGRRI